MSTSRGQGEEEVDAEEKGSATEDYRKEGAWKGDALVVVVGQM